MLMKDQYAADINDYCKYALLRALSSVQPGRLNVCWMLTPPDGRRDGGRVGYLETPELSRDLDPPLFDALGALVRSGVRTVQAVQTAAILPNARFHPLLLLDELEARQRYFDAFWRMLGYGDIVFFDPDNGVEVPSVQKGRRDSSKYLYWDELERALGDQRTVCVYQHFPRVPRSAFLKARLDRMVNIAPNHEAFAVASPWVAYLVCSPGERADEFRSAVAEVVHRPGSPLTLRSIA